MAAKLRRQGKHLWLLSTPALRVLSTDRSGLEMVGLGTRLERGLGAAVVGVRCVLYHRPQVRPTPVLYPPVGKRSAKDRVSPNWS